MSCARGTFCAMAPQSTPDCPPGAAGLGQDRGRRSTIRTQTRLSTQAASLRSGRSAWSLLSCLRMGAQCSVSA